ncbi:MAG: DUF2730 family protein [Geobacter sp.]|nr:MAG: DUF2730 family protein [Geobacter sp.]
MTNYQPWIFGGISIIQLLFSMGTWFYVRRENKDKVTNDRFKEAEDRLAKVETKVERMPVCGNHGRMEDNDVKMFKRLDDLHGDIRELTGGVRGLTRSVDVINEYLLKERK